MVNHPLQNAEVPLKYAFSKPQFFFFYKSAYLKTQHLGFSFKTRVLKNVYLDNVGPNTSFSTFLAQTACYLVDNAGPNLL